MTHRDPTGHRPRRAARRPGLLRSHAHRRVADPRHPGRGRALPHRAVHSRARRRLAGELPNNASNFWVYVWPLVFGTLWAAADRADHRDAARRSASRSSSRTTRPRRVAQALGYIIDLLAAVPSVVFGLWGIVVLAPFVQPFYAWLGELPRLDPALRAPGVRHRAHHPHRRHRARRDGPPDHDRHLPRDLPADARACTRRPRWRSARPAGR